MQAIASALIVNKFIFVRIQEEPNRNKAGARKVTNYYLACLFESHYRVTLPSILRAIWKSGV